ncbi:MAG: hypothetical protein CML67_13420 [Rhodobacteraceae bacterium]|uniref:cell envelope integrity EipB family protein n=1 Tax=Stappia stellulata TaxID=71235 RepID=UPI000C48BF87|nr:cell envelope integrity EipB family protein [Stappia stellulata]MBC00534.1 hypothetical protein [Paracoccaceae bacterium]MCA1241414.1 cell envelope integrity EipB family protein [Stappia stellulata]
MNITRLGVAAARTGATAVVLGAALSGAAQAAPTELLTHRAVYDLSLAETSQAAGISGVSGRMVYEFTGGPCEGYSVAFRFVIQVSDERGQTRVTDLQTSSFEDPASKAFQFLSKTYVNRKLSEETRGRAEHADDHIALDLKKPDEREVRLSGTALFPTEHLRRLLEAADKGETILVADLFDGSETGDKVYETTSVIGARRDGPGSPGEEDAGAVAKIGDHPHWPVTIAYFDSESEDTGERMPAYQLGFLLYDNGVSRRLKLDYGDFELRGNLSDLTLIDPVTCKQ